MKKYVPHVLYRNRMLQLLLHRTSIWNNFSIVINKDPNIQNILIYTSVVLKLLSAQVIESTSCVGVPVTQAVQSLMLLSTVICHAKRLVPVVMESWMIVEDVWNHRNVDAWLRMESTSQYVRFNSCYLCRNFLIFFLVCVITLLRLHYMQCVKLN